MNYRHTLFCIILCTLGSWAQSQAVFIDDGGGAVHPKRYDDMKGEPYLFDNWTKATIIDTEGEEATGVMANLNGYSGVIEIRKGEQVIELDGKYIESVLFHTDKGDVELLRGRELSSEFPFAIKRFANEEITFVEEFYVKVSEKTFNNYGAIQKVKRFTDKTRYWLIRDGQKKETKLKKKDFLNDLAAGSEIDKYIKKEKLKMKDVEDYVTVLVYFYSI